MDGRGPPSSSFLRQQRFRDLLRSPTLTHSWPVFDLQNMERLCKFWQNSLKRWTVGLGKLTALCGSLSAQLAKPLLSHGLPRAFLWYFLNPDGNSLKESELSKLQNSSWCAGGITQVAAIAAMVGRLRHLRRPHSSLIVRGWQQRTRKLVGGSLRREHPRVHFPHLPPTTPATCKPHKLPSLPASCSEEWAPPTI